MTASVARSPTLTPFRNEGIVPQLSQSPPTRSSLRNHNHNGVPHPQTVQRFAAPTKGLDSADLEAQRQEKAEVLAEEEARALDRKQEFNAIAAATIVGAKDQAKTNAIVPVVSAPDVDPQGPFEGPEKLMELWFADCPELLPEGSLSEHFSIVQDEEGNTLPGATPRRRLGLRAVSRPLWEEMLDLVHCKVLSVIEGDDFDAYLLR